MTGSVDNFWLYLALRFGVPTFLFLAGAYLISMIRIGGRNFRSDPDLLAVRRAWMFTQVSTCLVLATVAIWGEAYSLVLLMLGSGVWLETVKVRSKARLRAARPTERIPTSASLRQEGL
jgi:hypothetical protein